MLLHTKVSVTFFYWFEVKQIALSFKETVKYRLDFPWHAWNKEGKKNKANWNYIMILYSFRLQTPSHSHCSSDREGRSGTLYAPNPRWMHGNERLTTNKQRDIANRLSHIRKRCRVRALFYIVQNKKQKWKFFIFTIKGAGEMKTRK